MARRNSRGRDRIGPGPAVHLGRITLRLRGAGAIAPLARSAAPVPWKEGPKGERVFEGVKGAQLVIWLCDDPACLGHAENWG